MLMVPWSMTLSKKNVPRIYIFYKSTSGYSLTNFSQSTADVLNENSAFKQVSAYNIRLGLVTPKLQESYFLNGKTSQDE